MSFHEAKLEFEASKSNSKTYALNQKAILMNIEHLADGYILRFGGPFEVSDDLQITFSNLCRPQIRTTTGGLPGIPNF